MTEENAFRAGVYRHYKGNDYEVYELAIHSETLEPLVVYRPLYGEKKLWARPLSMFLESVELNGVSVPRFEYHGAFATTPETAPEITRNETKRES